MFQSELKDGRASLYLEFYLGRSETPVLDDEGNQVFYISGAMAGKPKYRIRHIRKRENLNLYIWLHPRNQQERIQNRNTLALPRKSDLSESRSFLKTVRAIGSKRSVSVVSCNSTEISSARE